MDAYRVRSLPDGVELRALSWSFEDEEAMPDQLEDGGAWECLGQAMPDDGLSPGLMMATSGGRASGS